MHESLSSSSPPPPRASEREFGLVFCIFFLIVALFPLLHEGSPRLWALGASGTFAALALIKPHTLKPLNLVWDKIGACLHIVTSNVALLILFYGIVTPTGLAMRLFGKNPMRLKFDREARTYWMLRTPPGPNSETLKNQF
ncbi:MAG: SxtJ family membrane protein [Bdellovibrionales bacterium]